MANEFIIKNGYRSQGNSEITGSTTISGSAQITGSLLVADSSGTPSLNTNTKVLYDSSAIQSLDWNNRILNNVSGTNVLDWRFQRLIDSNTTHSINWNTRNLITALGNTTVEWDSAKLNDTTGGNRISINWNTRKLYDSNTTESADWRVRTLKNSSGTTILDWQSAQVHHGHLVQVLKETYSLTTEDRLVAMQHYHIIPEAKVLQMAPVRLRLVTSLTPKAAGQPLMLRVLTQKEEAPLPTVIILMLKVIVQSHMVFTLTQKAILTPVVAAILM
jgi:hypothetical protein